MLSLQISFIYINCNYVKVFFQTKNKGNFSLLFLNNRVLKFRRSNKRTYLGNYIHEFQGKCTNLTAVQRPCTAESVRKSFWPCSDVVTWIDFTLKQNANILWVSFLSKVIFNQCNVFIWILKLKLSISSEQYHHFWSIVFSRILLGTEEKTGLFVALG